MDFATKITSALAKQIGQDRSDLWFDGVRFECDEKRICVVCPTIFLLERLKRDFQATILSCVVELGYPNHFIDFVVADASMNSAAGPAASADSTAQPEPSSNRDASDAPASSVDLGGNDSPKVSTPRRLLAPSAKAKKSRFRKFDTFVEGECNRLARKSAEMVVTQPGEISPLVIHGPTGVGKTHLMESIWCLARAERRRARVVYLSAEQFTTYFVDALRGNGLPNFRRKYRQADLLIIDDIQFFAGKQATLVELAYTIDELSRDNRQLVLSADRPPSQLAGVLGRDIANRLCGGLVCAMKPIEQETMQSISTRWASERAIQMDPELHSVIASRMQGDARQLSGVLNRLRAASVALKEKITLRMANEVMYELVPAQTRIVRMQDIRKIVCDVFGLEPDSLQQKTRSRAIAQPRMVAMYMSRRLTAAGLHEISQFFGRSSHSSAVSASTKVEKMISNGDTVNVSGQACDIRDVISQIESRLKAG